MRAPPSVINDAAAGRLGSTHIAITSAGRWATTLIGQTDPNSCGWVRLRITWLISQSLDDDSVVDDKC